MSSKPIDFILQSKLFVILLIITILLSSSVVILNPVDPSTPRLGKITIQNEGTFDLSTYPYLDRRVLGIWNSLREFYSVKDLSNTSINDITILPDILSHYFLAFTTYGLAQIVDSTPNYRTSYYTELFDKIIQMMNSSTIEYYEWTELGYTHEYYSSFGNGFRGPSNIMWTGHYALMELLYYNVFRDPKYNSEIKFYMDDWNTSLTSTLTWDNKTSLDDQGRPLGRWGCGLIPCEPYIVFVQCNSIPFYTMRLYDALHNTNYQDASLPGIDWWQTHMTDENGVQIDGYYVFEPLSGQQSSLAEQIGDVPGPSMTYGLDNVPKVATYGSTWAISFYNAFGETEIASTYYDTWKNLFVHYSPDDQAYAPDSYHFPSRFGIFDLVGTLFAYFCIREMGDEDLFRKLENWFYGPFPGEWDGYKYRFDTSALGDLGPFMDPILNFAYAWCHADSTLKDLMDTRDDEFFNTTPYISHESTQDGLFIYQAYFDEAEQAFILTVEANEDTVLTIDQFQNVQGVYTKSGEYDDWSQNGNQMMLTLTPGTYSFVII